MRQTLTNLKNKNSDNNSKTNPTGRQTNFKNQKNTLGNQLSISSTQFATNNLHTSKPNIRQSTMPLSRQTTQKPHENTIMENGSKKHYINNNEHEKNIQDILEYLTKDNRFVAISCKQLKAPNKNLFLDILIF